MSDPASVELVVLVRTSSRSTEDLASVLASLEPVEADIGRVIVSDSSVESRISADDLARAVPFLAGRLTVHCCEENCGPAVATNQGLALIETPAETTWVVVADDDQPFVTSYLGELPSVIPRLRALDPHVGAVCDRGHRLDVSRGRLVRPSKKEIRGLLPVDYVPTNHAPAFSVSALREIGGWREELFIGHTEVWLGRDLRAAGHTLYALGDLWNASDVAANWRGVTFKVARTAWRRYYSVRNLIVLVRQDAGTWPAMMVSLRSLAGWFLTDRSWEYLRMTVLAVRDGWLGRLGKTVEPGVRH